MKTIDQIINSGTLILVTDNTVADISKHVITVNDIALTTATTSSIYYNIESDTTVPGRALIKFYNLNSNTCYIFSSTVFSDPGIEFWSDDFNASALDTSIQGGTWTNGLISDALGINPEDLIIDGDQFMSPSVSYAPEELIPGNTLDSVGINVFTKGSDSYATVVSGVFDVVANTTTYITISILTEVYSGIMVYFNGQIFNRSTSTNIIGNQFFIDGRYLILPPQPVGGKGGYTYVNIGGNGLVDGNSVSVSNTNTAIVDSLISFDDARSVYVLVNGKEILPITTSTDYGYELKRNFYDSDRASVQVYNLPTTTATIDAWFFNTSYVNFNRMNEEIFVITNTVTSVTLSFPPSSWEPYSDKVIVEKSSSSSSTDRKRLKPPYTSNYTKTFNNRTYDIDNRRTYSSNYFSASEVFVFANGTRIRPGYDFNFKLSSNQIELLPNLYPDGTYISIVALKGTDYDYVIIGNILQFRVPQSNTNVRTITFNNHDQLFMNTEIFKANGFRRFPLSYPAIDDNFVWVYLDGVPLIHRIDWELLTDQGIIQLSQYVNMESTSEIMVTSIRNPEHISKVYGYRIFKDFFERDHFKRLSKDHTTFLLEHVTLSDTEIKVFESSKLSPHNRAKNIPGVILVDRERIEFFSQDYNDLGDLRRGTLGTSPAIEYDFGTKVIDQGIFQTIPYYESVYHYSTLTLNSSTYTIPFHNLNIPAFNNSNSIDNYGITLTTSTNILPIDQVSVYYGGKPLKKVSYEVYSTETNSIVTMPPEFSVEIKNTSVTTSTTQTSNMIYVSDLLENEIYQIYFSISTATDTSTVYTTSSLIYNSLSNTSTGTISGININYSVIYTESSGTQISFTNLPGTTSTSVSIDLNYQRLTLNIDERLEYGVQIFLTKKEGKIWTGTESLLVSNDLQSRFIRAKESELPDNYFYGGDPRLLDSNNVPLTDYDGTTLRRY